MRSTFFLATLFIFLGVVSATDYNVVSPWGNTTWTSGSSGKVVWTVIKGDSSLPTVTQCDLDLMRGNFSNADVVAHIATGVNVNQGQYLWQKLPDYASGSDYFVRVGTSAWYRYGHSFTFVGNGTVQSLAIPAPSLSNNGAAAAGPDNSTSSATPDNSTSSGPTTGGPGSSGGSSSPSGSSSTSSTTGGSNNSTQSGKSSAGFTNQANFVLLALGLTTLAFCTL